MILKMFPNISQEDREYIKGKNIIYLRVENGQNIKEINVKLKIICIV